MGRRLLGGFVLTLVIAGCGGASARPFAASATYSCLRKRPEYQAPGIPTGLGFAFTSLNGPPARLSSQVGKGAGFDLMFTEASMPGGGGGTLLLADLKFFSDTGDARAWRDEVVSRIGSADRPRAERAVQRERNLIIVWGNGLTEPSQRVSAIVHHCLRARSG
jgi:hypothetical protein